MNGNHRNWTAKPFDRKRYYSLLQVGKAELGWDDEFYRGIWLPRQGATPDQFGRYSATKLTNAQLMKAVEEMKRLGFKVKPKQDLAGKPASARKLADDGQSRKIRALWLEMHKAGIVRDPSEGSLAKYIKRLTGVEALQWLDTQQAIGVIEVLKKWQARVASRVVMGGGNES